MNPLAPKSTRKPWLPLVIAFYCMVVRPLSAQEEDSLSYKFQSYVEEKGRIEIQSHYVRLQTSLPYDLTFTASALADIITGATPTGLADPSDPTKLEYAEIDDRRDAFVVALAKDFGDHTLSFEFARSVEGDYESNGYSIHSESEFNQKNTTLSLGLSLNDDQVTIVDRGKETWDFAVGVTQLLSPKTLLEANFTVGYAQGFLSDPYKWTSQLQDLGIPGVPPIPIQFFENRPNERTRYVFRLGLQHYLEDLHASINTSYRYFQDDQGIRAHTLGFEWNQKFGDHIVLSPYYRYYHQSAGDYYSPNFDNAGFDLNDDRSGRPPYFSSDYRLSQFDAHSFGIKLAYIPTDWLTLDAAYERYEMLGQDNVTNRDAYPKANVITLGISARF